MRCVILKRKHGGWKFFGKLYWNLFSVDKDSNINVITTSYCSKAPLTIFSSLETVYTAVKSVKEPSIMEKYPILRICRTARFKIDWCIPKPETFPVVRGNSTFHHYYLLHLRNFSVFYLSFHSSLWSWRMILESGRRGRTGFGRKAGLLTALYQERLSCKK